MPIELDYSNMLMQVIKDRAKERQKRIEGQWGENPLSPCVGVGEDVDREVREFLEQEDCL